MNNEGSRLESTHDQGREVGCFRLGSSEPTDFSFFISIINLKLTVKKSTVPWRIEIM